MTISVSDKYQGAIRSVTLNLRSSTFRPSALMVSSLWVKAKGWTVTNVAAFKHGHPLVNGSQVA
jgi:hypothetical protein